MRVLFLSASVGVGHTSAANAVGRALRLEDPHAHVRVVDSYRYAASVVSRVVSDGYIRMVKTIPHMYRYLYSRAERATEVGPFRTWIHQFTATNLRPLLEKERPDVVVCTHAFPCGVMAEYKRLYADAPPVVGIVTDFAVHAYWIHRNIEGYAVATSQMRAAMTARGIEPDRVSVTGIPIDVRFGQSQQNRSDLHARLSLPPERDVVLMMGGGLGIGPLGAIVDALQEVHNPMCLVAIVGKNTRTEKLVRERALRVEYPVRVERFVDNVYDYMHAADVLVTKPGGLSVAEALASRVPTVLFKPLPGQEERNARYLMQHHAALRARTPQHVARTVQRLLSKGSLAAGLRESMGELAKPEAAASAAHLVRAAATKGAPA